MLNIFDPLKGILKRHAVSIDNTIFVLHYRATVLILIGFCIAVSSNQYIGDPIHCIKPTHLIPSSVINSYCWIHATFSVVRAFTEIIDVEVPHAGVDKTLPTDDVVYHSYYQWVAFMLILQAALFYVPRWLWKHWESGKLMILKSDLNKPMMKKTDKIDKEEKLAEYFYDNLNNHTFYFIKFFFCEILNFINVIGQLFLIDVFLGGEFTKYGIKVIEFINSEANARDDPMAKVFPRVTKCTFRSFGQSGDIQRHQTLCVLPINIINEKIYAIMWFWFVFVAVLSGLVIIYRIIIIVSKNLRFRLLRSKSRTISDQTLSKVVSEISVGDWFLLYMLSSNIDPFNFKDLIEKINELFIEKGHYAILSPSMESSIDEKDYEKSEKS